jgi:hypothetical protein
MDIQRTKTPAYDSRDRARLPRRAVVDCGDFNRRDLTTESTEKNQEIGRKKIARRDSPGAGWARRAVPLRIPPDNEAYAQWKNQTLAIPGLTWNPESKRKHRRTAGGRYGKHRRRA